MPKDILTIHNIFNKISSSFPERVALQQKCPDSWYKYTYQELRTLSLKLATYLKNQGFVKGDSAVLILENRPEWPIIYLGLMFSGLICVPLDPQLSGQEIKIFVTDSESRIIFCSQSIFDKKISPILEDYFSKIIILDAASPDKNNFISLSSIKNTEINEDILPEVSPDDIASLVYTSGTTAQSKGVMLTHKNICSNVKSILKLNILTCEDNVLAILPLYHTYAFMGTMIVPLFLGAKITYSPLSFKPSDLSKILNEAGVTILTGVPQFFALLYRAIYEKLKRIPSFILPLCLLILRRKIRNNLGKNIRLLVSGGARLEPKIGSTLSYALGVKIIEGYGLTETSPIVALNPLKKTKFGSVGKPIPGVQIKIMEPDKSGIGEVLIKGPNVMLGYFKRPELTAEVIKDGWFYSGDLGYIDKEGYLFLTARKKDVIVLSSGKNIYPEELEEHFSNSPYIKELCVILKTQERFGSKVESLYAVVVPDLEYIRQRNELDIQAKIRWELENLGKDLPPYKHVMGFVITKEDLPRTTLKKLKRYQVSKQFSDFQALSDKVEDSSLTEEDSQILGQDKVKKIIDYLNKHLKKPINLNSHLEIDLGIDSLSRVELALGLERIFHIKITDEIFVRISTVRDLIQEISKISEDVTPHEGGAQDTAKSWSEILKSPPSDKTLNRVNINASFLDVLKTSILRAILLCLFKLLYFLRTEGKDNLPKNGPYLICPNHASYLDGFVVFCSLPSNIVTKAFFLGYSDIFEQPVIRWSIKLAHLLPIDPNVNLVEAMQAVSFVIRQAGIVCIFPEGRRSVNDNLGDFKKGVGILIKELDIPVVPAYIKGSHRSWPRTSRIIRFFVPLGVSFGKPVTWRELVKSQAQEEAVDEYAAVSAGLKEEVLTLAKKI